MSISRETSAKSFINRLVGRSLGASATVEPRIASLFESANATSELSPASLASDDQSVVSKSLQRTIQNEPRSNETQSVMSNMHSAREASHSDPADAGALPDTNELRPEKVASGNSLLTMSSAPPQQSLTSELNLERETRQIMGDKAGIFSLERPPSFTARHSSDSEFFSDKRNGETFGLLNDPENQGQSTRHTVEVIGKQNVVTHSSPTDARRAEIQVTREKPFFSRNADRPNTLHSNAKSTEPVINISIGRIEVRAALSTEPKPGREKRGAAPLGLSEYLQNRTRGK